MESHEQVTRSLLFTIGHFVGDEKKTTIPTTTYLICRILATTFSGARHFDLIQLSASNVAVTSNVTVKL